MSDSISRQDAIRIVDQFSREEMFHYMESLELDVRATQVCHSAIEAVGTIKEQIEALPSADRPTGKWIKSDILPNGWHCSHCDAPVMTDDISEMLFCPNCGAEMVREDGEA